MGIKDFIFKKAFQRNLKGLPEDQRKMFMTLFDENPEFFEKISLEIKERKDRGQDESIASAAVMKKYQGELLKMIQNIKK